MSMSLHLTKTCSVASLWLLVLGTAAVAAIGTPQQATQADPAAVLLVACPPKADQSAQPLPKAQPRRQDGKAVTQATAPATAQIRGLRTTATEATATARGTEMRGTGPCAPPAPSM